MLPVKEGKSNLWLMHNKSQGLMYLNTASGLDGISQHLYFTSDREIKNGDWVLWGENQDQICQANSMDVNLNSNHAKGAFKKIEATTDLSLIISTSKMTSEQFREHCSKLSEFYFWGKDALELGFVDEIF